MDSEIKQVFYCPITGNQSITKMSRKAFDRACEKYQGSVGKFGVPQVKSCTTCQGNRIPETIEFIEIQGGVMADIRKSGRCSVCGKSKSVLERGGAMVCSMCENLRSSIRQTPKVVVAQLRELYPDFVEPTAEDSSGDQVATLQFDLADTQDKLDEALDLMNDWKNSHNKRLKELEQAQQEILDWSNKHAALGDDLRDAERNLDDTLKALAAERETSTLLAGRVESMIDAELHDRHLPTRGVSFFAPTVEIMNTAPMVSEALFNLAVDALAGRVTGIDADRLNALRGIV